MGRILVAAAAITGAAWAAPLPLTQRVVIANLDCWAVRAPFKSLSPEERVGRLNDRLAVILGEENLSPSNIYLAPSGAYTHIYVGRSHLFTCVPEDARMAGESSTAALARKWVRKLRVALPQAMKGANRDLRRRHPKRQVVTAAATPAETS
jgi:hypothetical protein